MMTPTWIRGGDPLRIIWYGQEEPGLIALQWVELSNFQVSDYSLKLKVGKNKKGEAVAYRMEGIIVGTARNLQSEVGWKINAGSDIEVPLLPLASWSKAWLKYVEGDTDSDGLLSELKQLSTGSVTITPPPTSSPHRSPLIFSLMTMLLGIGIGWILHPHERDAVIPQDQTVEDQSTQKDEKEKLLAINDWVEEQGLPRGLLTFDLGDFNASVLKANLDIAWPQGILKDGSQPVAVLLNETAEAIALASQAGFSCFTDDKAFKNYVETEILSSPKFQKERAQKGHSNDP